MYVVGAWVPPAIILIWARGKKDTDVDTIKDHVDAIRTRLDEMDGGRDQKIKDDAILATKLSALAELPDKFTKLREEFVEHRTETNGSLRTLNSNMRFFRSSLEGVQRQMAEIVKGGPHADIYRLTKEGPKT